MNVLVTGCAGFIGFHTCKRLIDLNHNVIGIDNLNNYYSVKLKKDRVKFLKNHKNTKRFKFYKFDLINKKKIFQTIKKNKIKYIIHLAAQAGVRYSLINPHSYTKNNIEVFLNILEASRNLKIKHLTYASTSSVYGMNEKTPLKETEDSEHPIQIYAATKRANELMAHSYSHLFGIPTTGFRFFTVYGPWGRPDMSIFLFVKAILKNKPINIFNYGKHYISFTYVDDIVNGIIKVIKKIPSKKNKIKINRSNSKAPFRIINLGTTETVYLMNLIKVIEKKLGKKSIKNYQPLQLGDISKTEADISEIRKIIPKYPKFTIEYGVSKFIDWYKSYHKIKN